MKCHYSDFSGFFCENIITLSDSRVNFAPHSKMRKKKEDILIIFSYYTASFQVNKTETGKKRYVVKIHRILKSQKFKIV